MNEDDVKFIVYELIDNGGSKNISELERSFKELLEDYNNRIDKHNDILIVEFALRIIQKIAFKTKKYWNRVEIPGGALEKFIRWGFNLAEIGTFYNVSRETISKRVVEYGLDYLFKEGYEKKVDKRILVDFVSEGANIGFLSEYFRVPGSLIARLMRKWGLELNPPISKYELEKLLSEEKTFTEIVELKEGRISYKSLIYWTKKYGLWNKRTNPRRKYDISREGMAELIKKGFRGKEMADYYNCSVANIYVRLKDCGLKIKK